MQALYLERLRGLREAKESFERTTTEGISAERAIARLDALSATWREADVPEAIPPRPQAAQLARVLEPERP